MRNCAAFLLDTAQFLAGQFRIFSTFLATKYRALHIHCVFFGYKGHIFGYKLQDFLEFAYLLARNCAKLFKKMAQRSARLAPNCYITSKLLFKYTMSGSNNATVSCTKFRNFKIHIVWRGIVQVLAKNLAVPYKKKIRSFKKALCNFGEILSNYNYTTGPLSARILRKEIGQL